MIESTTTDPQDVPTDARGGNGPKRPVRFRRVLTQCVLWFVVADVPLVALLAGLWVRAHVWENTSQIRFTGDIINGYNQGSRGVELGYWKVYDHVVERAEENQRRYRGGRGRRTDARGTGEQAPLQFDLDYSPLRLAVVTAWVRSVRESHPGMDVSRWRPEFTTPLLRFNTACELACAVAVFLIVRLWVRRDQISQGWPHGRPFWRSAWFVGLLAAILFWFNPAIIWDAHAWPQWDVWCLPFFFWAIFFASVDGWLIAGLLLAIGAMFKGQILLVAPVIVLWPLFSMKWGAVVRALAGFALAVAAITFPWLVRTPEAHQWLSYLVPGAIVAALAPVLVAPLSAAAGIVLGGIALGWWATGAFGADRTSLLWYPVVLTPVWAGSLIIMLCAMRPKQSTDRTSTLERCRKTIVRWRPLWAGVALATAAAVFLAALLYDGSMSWYAVGFEYGTRHFLDLSRKDVCNLPAILQQQFGWSLNDLVYGQTTIKTALAWTYFITLGLCGIGAAWHGWRRDKRMLISLVAPWVLLFAILPQMHQRYLMWAAGATALCVGVSFGYTLLHLLVTALAWSMIAHTLLRINPSYAPGMYEFLEQVYPGISSAVVLVALVFLYGSIAGSGRGVRKKKCLPPA